MPNACYGFSLTTLKDFDIVAHPYDLERKIKRLIQLCDNLWRETYGFFLVCNMRTIRIA